MSLNAITINCATNVAPRTGARCPGNPALLRDIQVVAGAVTATVSGNTATGTKVDTYNVLVSGTQTVVGTLIVNSSFSMTCADCGPSAPSANYPSLLGTWTGYLDRDVISDGVFSANQCLATWSIRTQTGGDFAGSFTAAPISGASTPCTPPTAQPTAFSGSMSTSTVFGPSSRPVTIGALAAETMPGCALQGQSLLIGVAAVGAGTPAKLLLNQENYFLCGTSSAVQYISFNLTRSGS